MIVDSVGLSIFAIAIGVLDLALAIVAMVLVYEHKEEDLMRWKAQSEFNDCTSGIEDGFTAISKIFNKRIKKLEKKQNNHKEDK